MHFTGEVFTGYSWGIRRLYICIGYVSGMYRVCVGYVSGMCRERDEGDGARGGTPGVKCKL